MIFPYIGGGEGGGIPPPGGGGIPPPAGGIPGIGAADIAFASGDAPPA